MRSVPSASPPDDLTARARIRDTAISRFAADGFAVGLRAIAADAGVSPALVIHHFGSKDGLRRACDAQVLALIHDARAHLLDAADPRPFLTQLAVSARYAWLGTYLLRSLQAGGDLARRIVDDLVDETLDNLESGVAAGTVRPSRDPRGRAEYLTRSSLGFMLLDYSLQDEPPADLSAWTLDMMQRSTLVGLEAFTDGLFTDSRYLDAYLDSTPDPS
jgi:AcrR family transcriptional regulator